MSNLPKAVSGPFRVQHVADGDTFVLKDKGRRIRVLGVDTPELKAGAPFSKEAKSFTQRLVDQKDVWLSYGSERNDRFGRELCIVFVQDETVGGSGGYKCLNEELIRNGLAYFYCLTPMPLESRLMEAQKEARREKRNIWQDFKDFDAVVTSRGRCFHSRECESINQSRVTSIKASAAFDKGLSPCRNCLNDDGIDHDAPTNIHDTLGVISRPPKSSPWTKNSPRLNQRIAGQIDHLPKNTKRAIVKSVVDGDTLQLEPDAEGSKRVQLLGVNAPESETKTRDAAIATAFLNQLIPSGSEVYLQFDRSGDEDNEGNWIAMVYAKDVTDGEGYICVNIALIGEGLAVFEDRTTGQLINEAQMVKVQRQARNEAKGLWNDRTNTFFQASKHENTKVFVEGKNRLYHASNNCRRIRKQNSLSEELLFDVLDDGLQPCHACKAPFLFFEDEKAQEALFAANFQHAHWDEDDAHHAAFHNGQPTKVEITQANNATPPPKPVPSQAPPTHKKDAFSKCCTMQ